VELLIQKDWSSEQIWESLGRKIVTGLTPHKERVHTLTYDNGKELTEHEQIAKALGVEIYIYPSVLIMGTGVKREHERADSSVLP
jgi:IS30 family transposase